MNILNVCHVYPPEHAPAGVQARDFAEDMTRAGHDVTILTGWPSHPAGILYPGWASRFREVSTTPEGFKLVRCGHSLHARTSMAWRLCYYFTFAVSAFINGVSCRRPDVVFCESTPIFGPVITLLLARLKRAKFVYRIHDVHPEAALHAGLIRSGLLYRMLRALDTWVCHRSDLVLTLTEEMRRCLLARGLPRNQVMVARQWLDGSRVVPKSRDNEWRRAHGIPLNCFVVLYAGTIGHISGANVVVEAARLLRDRRDVLFLFVGEGPLKEECQKLNGKYGLENIRFLPFQPAEALADVQATGDAGLVTLLPASGETSVPSKIHGYTAAGRAVIASVHCDSATAKSVREGDFGLVVEPGDAQALANAVADLAGKPSLTGRFGHNARLYFLANFDRFTQTDRLERVLRVKVCERPRNASCPIARPSNPKAA